ncbi:hypothetical protein [Endozoicomonas sp. SESOKO2]|uniref:hypothetical protein n=1 Tax=Endozoicomonas sp. SESOKO2 TaxID=2828743 RepID=UPI0021481AD2|nr:hypothetical protein [Endozoicomonas sp. SESOKO2]
MEFKKVAVAIALSAGLASVGLQAAVNPGTPTDNSSTGTFDITLYNNSKIQIYGLEDVEINDTDGLPGTTDATGSTPVCVAANTDQFNISMSTAGGTFELTNTDSGSGAANIPYTLQLQDSAGSDVTDGLWGVGGNSSGVLSSEDLDVTTNDFNNVSACSGANSYSIVVAPDYTSADPGIYTGTAIVTVSPI